MTNPQMTWVKARKGWMKKHRGQMYSVSCKQLGTEPTKEASVKAANDWWEKKLGEIDAKAPEMPKDARWELDHLTRDRDYAQLTGDAEGAAIASREIDQLQADVAKGEYVPGPTVPRDHYFESHKIRTLERVKTGSTAGNTIEDQIKDFLSDKEAEVHAGQIKPTTLEALRHGLREFRTEYGIRLLSSVNEIFLKECVNAMLGLVKEKKISPRTASGRLSAVKQFLRDRHRLGTLDRLPRNFDYVNIQRKQKVPWPYSSAEVKTILEKAHPRLRLYLLIMLNTGATQIDVSELRKFQVKDGRIARKRTKEEDEKRTPTISYLLWAQTGDLLEQYQNTDQAEERALLNADGNPLYSARVKAGKMTKTDSIRLMWVRFKSSKLTDKEGNAIVAGACLKRFRKTGSSLLADSDYADCQYHYLGHAASSVAAQSYSAPPQNRFDDAIRWLGDKLGIK